MQLTISTSFNIDLGFELAPIHKRILATILDMLVQIVYIYLLAISLFTGAHPVIDDSGDYYILWVFLLFSPVLFYHLLSEVLMEGESIGKRVMGLHVISLDGNKPTFSQYLLRWFLRSIDFSFTSYVGGLICSAVTKNSQRIGDLAAGTTVVSNKLPYSINNTIFKFVDEKTYQVSYPEVMKLSDRDINTVNNILQQHRKTNSLQYVITIAEKIQTVLKITTTESPESFLDTLLTDYNYLSTKK
jgi:uncharacterized RDD family membrane protein YckC